MAEPLRELHSRGVSNSVFAVDTFYRPRKQPSEELPAEWIRYPQIPGSLGLSSAGTFLGALLFNRVRQLHRRSPVSVIHAHAALPCGDAAAYLSHHLGIPFVVTIHGLDVFNSCLQQGIAAGWRRKASLKVYKNARKVICISDKVRRLLTEAMGPGVAPEVIYNGVAPDLFKPGLAESPKPVILMVGNLLAIKGHELVLRALVELKDSHPGLQCRIIGDGVERNRLAGLAQDFGIGDQVHFLGRRSRSEVAVAMRECTVFALPSRYEGLGCVYLEAMACSKPVIACQGQGIDEVIHHGDNGWLIPVDGLKELTESLRVLVNDAKLRTRIGEAARQTILRNFTLSHQAESLMKIYEEASW